MEYLHGKTFVQKLRDLLINVLAFMKITLTSRPTL